MGERVLREREVLDLGRVALFAAGLVALAAAIYYLSSGSSPAQSIASIFEYPPYLPGLREFLALNQTVQAFSVLMHGGNGSVGYWQLSAANITDSQITNATLTNYTCSGASCNFTVFLDSDNSTSQTGALTMASGTISQVYYVAPDGSLRDAGELGQAGQGNFSFSGSRLNYTLAGGDGFDYGLRDSQIGGSYWLNETGGLYGRVNISNDFITVGLTETGMRIYNSSGKAIYNSSFDGAVKLDNRGLVSLYGSGTQNKTVYFFDWVGQKWKQWSKADLTGFSDSFSGYSSQASADSAWNSSVPAHMRVNLTINGMQVDFHSGFDSAIVHDLQANLGGQNVSDSKWVLRFKWHIDAEYGADTEGWFGLSDRNQSVPYDNQHDFMGVGFLEYNAGPSQNGFYLRTSDATNLSPPGGTPDDAFTLAAGQDWWIEMARNGTSLIVRRYADSGYSSLSKEISGAAGSGIQGLRYIKFITYRPAAVQLNTTVDDVKFWNGVSSVPEAGVPDWTDPRNKQAFKWRYAFSPVANSMKPSLNLTFHMTAHDPFVRVFADAAGARTLEDDYSTNSSWSGTSGKVTVTNGTLNVNNYESGDEQWVSYDLQRVLGPGNYADNNVGWVMRFKIVLNSLTNDFSGQALKFELGLVDSTSLTGENPYVSVDSVHYAVAAHAAGSTSNMYAWAWTTANENTAGVSRAEPLTATRWVELVYSASDPKVEARVYTDEYMTLEETITGQISSKSFMSDLRYVFAKFFYQGVTNNNIVRVDDLQFWDGTTLAGGKGNVTIPISFPENRTSVTTAESGLVGYWNFNEGQGANAADVSESSNDLLLGAGSSSASPYWVPNFTCKFGGCIGFDGSDDYLLNNNTNFLRDQTGTVAFWFRTYSTSTAQILWQAVGDNGDTVTLMYRGDLSDEFQYITDPGSGSPTNSMRTLDRTVSDTNWHFIVVTSDGSTVRMYVDNMLSSPTQQEGTNSGQWFGDLVLNDFGAGRSLTDSSNFYRGLMDDMRAYSRVISSDEMRLLYTAGMNQQKPGIYFTKNNATEDEEVLFVTTNWKNVNHSASGNVSTFNITSNQTDWIRFGYTFNRTQNQNFMFALGTLGRMNTTTFSPANNATGFSSETMESVANSTLTWYDIRKQQELDEDFSGCTTNECGGLWDSSNTAVFSVNTATDKVDFSNDASSVTMRYDLGPVSDSKWVLRLNFTISSLGGTNLRILHMYLSNNGGASSTAMDGVQTYFYDADNNVYAASMNNGRPDQVTDQSGLSINPTAGTSYYVEMVRVNETAAKVTVYSDPGYTAVMGTKTWQINSTIDKLRYVTFSTYSGALGTFTGTVDDVEFWDGVTQPTNSTASHVAGGSQQNFKQTFSYDGGAAGIWRFDEGGGLNATDASGNSNPGTLVNGPSWVKNSSCKFDSCLSFDGSNDYVLVRNDGSGMDSVAFWNGDWTASLWVNKRATPSPQHAMMAWARTTGVNDGWEIFIDSSNYLGFGDYDNSPAYIYSQTTLGNDVWYHVVVRKSGTTVNMFLNGAFQGTNQHSSSFVSSLQDFTLGARWEGSVVYPCNCLLDDIRIYPRALSESEISDRYQRGVTKYYDDFATSDRFKNYRRLGAEDSNASLQPFAPSDVTLHYRFNENSTSSSPDYSGKGNSATVSGATWSTNSSCMAGFGGCMLFDGNNDYAQASSMTFTGDMAVSMWIYPRGIASTNMLTGDYLTTGGTQWQFWYAASTNQVGLWRGSTIATTPPGSVPSNRWSHVAMTRVGTGSDNVKIYVNGNLTATGTLAGTFGGGSSTMIGLDGDLSQEDYGGFMDEYMLFQGRSLSADEAYQLYMGGAQRRAGELSAWWKFNDNTTYSGTVFDNSGNGKTGNSSSPNVPVWIGNASCRLNGCLSFDGSNDRVVLPDGTFPTGQSPRTFCFWSAPNVATEVDVLYSGLQAENDRFLVRLNEFSSANDVTVISGFPPARVLADNVLTQDVWNHVCASFDGSGNVTTASTRIYVNGLQKATSLSGTSIPATSAVNTVIGYDPVNNQNFYKGRLDDVKVWKRALTADEVMHEYLNNQDQHSIYGNIHRVASADGVSSASFNLTDKDGPYQRDYDQRQLLFSVTMPDSTPPSISVQSPGNATYSDASIWANVTLDEEGSAVMRSLDGAANASLTNSTGNWNGLISGLSDGPHAVTFYANDTTGNSASASAYFTVTATPNITLTINRTFNPLIPWWVEYVNISGHVAYTNGTPFTDTVVVNETNPGRPEGRICQRSLSSSGSFYCNFTSKYQVTDTVIWIYAKSGSYVVASASGLLETKPNYGQRPAGSTPRSVLETPLTIQEPSSAIRTIITRLVISRGTAA